VANTHRRVRRLERDISPAKDWDVFYMEVDRLRRESLFDLLNGVVAGGRMEADAARVRRTAGRERADKHHARDRIQEKLHQLTIASSSDEGNLAWAGVQE
jgi:hypothetical protein